MRASHVGGLQIELAMFVPRSVSKKPVDSAKRSSRRSLAPEKNAVIVEDLRSRTEHADGQPENAEREAMKEETPPEQGRKRRQEEGEEEEEEEEEVISYSKLQRWPEAGEPVCVECGRYGAYIVDQTDEDVCSLECKARHLKSLGKSVVAASESDRQEGGEWSYGEHPAIAGMTGAQVEALRREMSIEVKGDGMPRPVLEFQLLPLSEQMRANLEAGGYATPTPVQMQAIPAALTGRDLLVCASTGSGKILESLFCPPTRELSIQIEEQAKQLIKGVPSMRTAQLVGGLPIANQLHRLRTGVQVVSATPARLIDILENHGAALDLSGVRALVLDEVDCLLHMGFEGQVRKVEESLPRSRQLLMFSATIPPRIEKMASELMSQPLYISVGVPGSPCESVKHTVVWVEEAGKKKRLFSCVSDRKLFRPPAVVFVNSKMGTLLLAEAINKTCSNVSAIGLHGDMAQERRSAILKGLQDGLYSLVVSTGVLARGVDLVHVRQVFVFDLPSSLREFIHQVGRAGRLGSPGHAITFINNENKGVFAELVDLLEPMGVPLPPQLLQSPHLALQRERRKRRSDGDHGRGGKKWDGRGFYDKDSLMDLIRGSGSVGK